MVDIVSPIYHAEPHMEPHIYYAIQSNNIMEISYGSPIYYVQMFPNKTNPLTGFFFEVRLTGRISIKIVISRHFQSKKF